MQMDKIPQIPLQLTQVFNRRVSEPANKQMKKEGSYKLSIHGHEQKDPCIFVTLLI